MKDIITTRHTVPLRLPKRVARVNGDTRRRKRRLREKIAKKDIVRFAPMILACAAEMRRRVIEPLERKMCGFYD